MEIDIETGKIKHKSESKKKRLEVSTIKINQKVKKLQKSSKVKRGRIVKKRRK